MADILEEAFGVIDTQLGPAVDRGLAPVLGAREFDEQFGNVHGGTQSIAEQFQNKQKKKAKAGQKVSLTKDEETGEDIERMPVPDANAAEMESNIRPSVQKAMNLDPGPSKYTLEAVRNAGKVTGADRAMSFFSGLRGRPTTASSLAQARAARTFNLFQQEQAARNKLLEEQAIRERQNPDSDYNRNFRAVAKSLYSQLNLPIEVSETMVAEDLPFLKSAFEKSMNDRAMQQKDKQWYAHKNAEAQQKLTERALDMEDFLQQQKFRTDEAIRKEQTLSKDKLARALATGGAAGKALALSGEEVPRSFAAGARQQAETGAEATADLLMFQADQVGIEGANRDRLQNLVSRMAALEAGGKMSSPEYRSYATSARQIISESGKEIDEAREQAVPGWKPTEKAAKLNPTEMKQLRDQDAAISNLIRIAGEARAITRKMGIGSKAGQALLAMTGYKTPEVAALREKQAQMVNLLRTIEKTGVPQQFELSRFEKRVPALDSATGIASAENVYNAFIGEWTRAWDGEMKQRGFTKTRKGGPSVRANRKAGTADKPKTSAKGPAYAVFELSDGKRVRVKVNSKEEARRALKAAQSKFGEGVSWKQYNPVK